MSAERAREVLAQPRVAPSILSADFSRLGDQVTAVLVAGARVIHVDVMDGHFVPPITMGPLVVAALRDRVHDAGAILDVHLMIERPELQVEAFAQAGADVVTVHAEVTPHVHYALKAIREHDCLAGLAICPGTSPSALAEVAQLVDVALVMSVNPGWGGQSFIPATLPKITRVRDLLDGEHAVIEVDGGIDPDTAVPCAEHGATLFVAGTAVFGAPDPGVAYAALADAVVAAAGRR